MRKQILKTVLLLLIAIEGRSQQEIDLHQLTKFASFANNSDFLSLMSDYGYKLYKSNLIKSVSYDEFGMIDQFELKKFNALKDGDSLLFSKTIGKISPGKGDQRRTSYLSFRQTSNNLTVAFETEPDISGYDFLDRLITESQTIDFTLISNDTSYYEKETIINRKSKKEGFLLSCSEISKSSSIDETSPRKNKISFVITIQHPNRLTN